MSQELHPLHIANLIDGCAATTKSKGFDVTQVGTQVALFVTEIAEALEHVTPTGDGMTDAFIQMVRRASDNYEEYRKHSKNLAHGDASAIRDQEHFLEELSDITIRIFSFVGGNDLKAPFIVELTSKMQYNATRPEKHGKAF